MIRFHKGGDKKKIKFNKYIKSKNPIIYIYFIKQQFFLQKKNKDEKIFKEEESIEILIFLF